MTRRRVFIYSSCSCWPQRASQTAYLLKGEEAACELWKLRDSLAGHLSQRRLRPAMQWAHWQKHRRCLLTCMETEPHSSVLLNMSIEKVIHWLLNSPTTTCLGKSWWHSDESLTLPQRDTKPRGREHEILMDFIANNFVFSFPLSSRQNWRIFLKKSFLP